MLTYEQLKEWSEDAMDHGRVGLGLALQLAAFELVKADSSLREDTAREYLARADITIEVQI